MAVRIAVSSLPMAPRVTTFHGKGWYSIWGGPSNQVAIFAQNDHGPQPCESVEYTVYLTDNPFAKDAIEDPTTTGADPQKWNRAVLKKIFTKGFVEVRPPNPAQFGAACGDTAQYSVEEDSFVQVHSMPCGINFRYTSIVAGYDGKEFPACQFHSQEGEVDAVAGLTEDGSGVCPDADKDGFVDCSCTGAPTVCDCNDADDKVHPGAPEACDAGDLNCDGVPGSCSGGLFCHQSICVPACQQGEFACPKGSTCAVTSQGPLCVPSDCSTGGCPPGSTCDPVSKTCKPACDGVVCPFGQKCNDGKCIDPCANLVCPSPKQCIAGECVAPCSCFAGDVGCKAGEVCDKGNTDLCTTPACKGVTCAPGQHCDPGTGQCQGICDGVKCPPGETCDPVKKACVGLCDGITCAAGEVCDPATGKCVDDSCKNVTCIPPSVCVGGSCVAPDGGVGGGPADASADGAAASGGGTLPPKGSAVAGDDGGCGCTTPGGRRGTFAAVLALLGLGVLAARRRRAS